MTICIAAICNNDKSIVVASDRMISAGFLALEFEHPDSKIESLSQTCVGLTAGDALVNAKLFRACRGVIQGLQSPSVEVIANEVQRQFVDLRRQRVTEKVLSPRGLDLEQFYQAGLINRLPPELAFAIDREIQETRYPLEVMIAGVDETGAHIYGVSDPGVVDCYDGLGYQAIGSGLRHALLTIVGNKHSRSNSLNSTVYLVYEAKRTAECAQGVGLTTEVAITSNEKTVVLSEKEKNLLDQIYKQKTSPQMKEVEEAISKLPFEEGK